MFQFNPLSDAELEDLSKPSLLPDGEYTFIVRGVEQKTSQSGNAMLKVKLLISFGITGAQHIIFDYLINTPKMMFKLKHFCESLNMEKEYGLGCFDPNHCLNRTGKVIITTQKGEANPNGGFYPDKNVVKDYVPADFSQDIPF